MFELPNSKRVRRDELHSATSSPRSSPDPDLDELLRSRAHVDYTFTDECEEADNLHGSDEEEAEIVLFATTASAAPQSHKIRLTSPDAVAREPGLLVKKPRGYYFADDLKRDRKAELEAAAVDGATILQLSREPWPGCSLPWKVKTISGTGMKKAVLVGHPRLLTTIEESVQKRGRKGKKSRIALRKKMQAATERKAEAERIAKAKEDTEREKRTRKNREKKLKQKAKAHAKRLAEGAQDHLTELKDDNSDSGAGTG